MHNIVLVGAGGTGMSGIAGMLYDLGYTNIICIDNTQSQLTDKLEKLGLKVIIGHNMYNVHTDDFVIYSAAAEHSPEVQKAKQYQQETHRKNGVYSYFAFLGEISKYFVTVGCTGTNGKSSSTAMAITAAKKLLSQTAGGILGALVPELNNNSYRINDDHTNKVKNIFDHIFTGKRNLNYEYVKKYLFIVEACEYKRHFLHFDLDYALITNLALDHTDYYRDEEDYLSAFHQFADRVKKHIRMPDNLPQLTQFKHNKKIIPTPIAPINFYHLLGDFNHQNGSLVTAMLEKIAQDQGTHVSKAQITQTLQDFHGLRRRMELLRTNEHGVKVYTDYGHHPDSFVTIYDSIRKKFPDKKLVAIFQPHQINRIATYRDAFADILCQFDDVMIYDIYTARESLDVLGKTGKGHITSIQQLGDAFAADCEGTYSTDIDAISTYIQSLDSNHVITIFSAGDLDYKIRQRLHLLQQT